MNNEITNPINLILIIVGLFLGLTLGIFLLFNNSAKNKANIYLGILVLLSITYFAQAFFYRFDILEMFPHTIGIQRLVNFSIGPLTYLYVRACIQKGFKMHPILWLHFLPFAIDVLISLPFYLQSGPEKVDAFLRMVQNGTYQTGFYTHVIVAIHSISYFILSARLIFQYREHLNNETASVDSTFHSWVLVFISIHALPVVLIMISVFSSYGEQTLMLMLLGFFTFSVAVYIAVMVKPELFHAFPHQMLLPNSTEEKKQRYENSNLQEDRKERFLKKLLNYFETEKPYLSSELTLAELSEQIQIPSHYLSQVINEKMNCTFLDFVNGYRVRAAKRMLREDDNKQFTIISIAYDAGFNSKSTFYSAFKKHAGTTPSNYRKSLAIT